MSTQNLPGEVVAAIAVAVAAALDVSPDRLHLRLIGPAPKDDDRGAWELAGRLSQMG